MTEIKKMVSDTPCQDTVFKRYMEQGVRSHLLRSVLPLWQVGDCGGNEGDVLLREGTNIKGERRTGFDKISLTIAAGKKM